MTKLSAPLIRQLDFCDTHPANDMPRALRERLMTKMISDHRCIIELDYMGQTAMIAVLIDAVKSQVVTTRGMGSQSDFAGLHARWEWNCPDNASSDA